MFHRPLIPILFAFAGGLLVARYLPASFQKSVLFLFGAISLSVISTLFLPPRLMPGGLLLAFFLTGILLKPEPVLHSRLLPLAHVREQVTLQGVVMGPMKVREGEIARLRVHVTGMGQGREMVPVSEDIQLTVYGFLPRLASGAKIRFPARLRPFKNFRNPGRYDYESAMKLKGISCAAHVSDGRRIVPMGPGELPFPLGAVEKLRSPLRDFFASRLDPRDRALFSALILGERQGVDPGLREFFNRTGLGHILAVSGLHIGLVAWISFFFFKGILGRSYRLTLQVDVRKTAALLTCLPVIGYTLLAGFQISSQRAMIMALVFLASFVLGREKDVWSTLALAGLIILFLNPDALFSISFQLSFAAVIGILWLTPVFLRILPAPWHDRKSDHGSFQTLIGYFAGLAAVTVSATLFLLPITCTYFHRIPLVSVPANVTAVPLLALWVIPSGLLCALTLPLSPLISGAFLELGTWGLNIMTAVIQFWADLSWASIRVVTPNLFEICLFYVLLFSVFFFRKTPWARLGLIAVLVLISVDMVYWIHRVWFNTDLRVTFLDVGKGNAALVEFPKGKKMVIDGGGFPGGRFDVGEMVVAPFLWQAKILNIDYLVLSHPQSDHMNGLRFLAKAFDPEEFWYTGDTVDTPSFKALMHVINAKGVHKLRPSQLKKGRLINGAQVEILHPFPTGDTPPGERDGKWLNNNSLVLKITYAGKSFLFPGDVEAMGEKALVARVGKGLKSDILLSPHHGSNTSSSAAFLKRVTPRLCVVSSGEGNPNFPHRAVLERLGQVGCRVVQTARSGAVQVRAGPKQLSIDTFVETPKTRDQTLSP
ncbi:MAG: DNA internalization-related competence protein ComEC/Rec2 [Thermodesulfobacteriota bacterium]